MSKRMYECPYCGAVRECGTDGFYACKDKDCGKLFSTFSGSIKHAKEVEELTLPPGPWFANNSYIWDSNEHLISGVYGPREGEPMWDREAVARLMKHSYEMWDTIQEYLQKKEKIGNLCLCHKETRRFEEILKKIGRVRKSEPSDPKPF